MFRIVDANGQIVENCTCLLRATAEKASRNWTALLGRPTHVVVV
jgi:hypothetical protein